MRLKFADFGIESKATTSIVNGPACASILGDERKDTENSFGNTYHNDDVSYVYAQLC